MASKLKILAAAAFGAALSAWGWSHLSKAEKPEAVFLFSDDQNISAKAFCYPQDKEPECSLPDLGVERFDNRLVSDLKLNEQCNGLPILLYSKVGDTVGNPAYLRPKLYLYVDYYPGQSSADWSLWYERGDLGLRSIILDIIGRPKIETIRPLVRGNVADIASETCALADLRRGG